MTTPETINFIPVRPLFVVRAQELCDVFNKQYQDKQGVVVRDVGALQHDDTVVLLIGYAEIDLVAVESLMHELSINPDILVVVNVPENPSLARGLRLRAQGRLGGGGGKIMEMPNGQESLSAFAQSLFDDSEDPGYLPPVTATVPANDHSHSRRRDEKTQTSTALFGDNSHRLSLSTIAEMLGFSLSDMCKTELERLPYETDLPKPYLESAEETQTKAIRIINDNVADKQENQIYFKRRLLLLSFIALCDMHRKKNHPDEGQTYSKVVFMKTDDDKDLLPLLILVEIMHVEYTIFKNDPHYSAAKVIKEINDVEDSALKNFLSALICHVLLKVADEEKAVSLQRRFDDAFLQMTEEQKYFFRTPEANAVAKVHDAVKDIL